MAAGTRHVLVLVAVGAVAWFAFFLLDFLSDRGPSVALNAAQFTLLLALSLLTVYAILAIHEFGHLVGSWIVGLRFQSLTVGPVTLVRQAGRIVFRWNLHLGLFRGVVRFEASPDEPPSRRLAVVLAAGPMTSVAVGVLGAMVALSGLPESQAGLSPPAANFIAFRLLALLASGSIAVGLANLIPVRFAGGSSDGERLWDLLRRSRRAAARHRAGP